MSFRCCPTLEDFTSAVSEIPNAVEILIVACAEELLGGFEESEELFSAVDAIGQALYERSVHMPHNFRIYMVPYLPRSVGLDTTEDLLVRSLSKFILRYVNSV